MSDNVFLPTGDWRLWSQFSLRGPGFPAAGVLRLAPDGLAAAADKFDEQLTGADWAAFEEEFGAAAVRTARELQDIAARPDFRAAVAWQNRTVLDTGIKPFLAWTPSADNRSSMPRQREELVAHYWQRFCVKNDTIGFFGPVGWGRWDLGQPGVTIDPGTGLIAESTVYFSSWAIDTLARVLGEDPALRRWIPPRRVSFVRIATDAVHLPGRPSQPITPDQRELLLRCDGTRSPVDLAAQLNRPEAEVLAAIEDLVRRRWLVWRLEVPTSAHPEQHLRSTVERVGDPEVRERALAKLTVLEQAKARIHDAYGDSAALSTAMAALEQDFATLTESAAVRAKNSRTAPCRSLVYADCRRSATATLGAAVLAELTPLALCLTAARWLTNRFAEAMTGRIRAAHRKLLDRHGRVDLGALWFECLPVPHPDSTAEIDRIQAELRARWARIIKAPQGVRRVRLSAVDIADRVHAEFGEPGLAWNIARYVSPDVLVLAENAEAVARGEFELVLGELHVAMNTVGASLFAMQHPDITELLAETTRDFPGPRVMPMLPKEQPPRWSTRSRPALVRPEDYFIGMVDYTADPHHPRALNSADVEVVDCDGELLLILPDGTEFPLLDVFGNALTNRVMDRFSLRPNADHSPRITVDRMIIARETWRIPAADLVFAAEKTESRRFVRVRQWREELDLPRFVFVTSPAEPRPFYVDFDSPVYVTILAKAARRLARTDPEGRLTISEMLPNPEQAWLTDDQGNRYTSELRFVAVDQTGGAA
ncbi:lantibiotic dehydratase [Crossiella sp. CA-258035]|uniref:lantibiotic dehydratase n=1 Tax=Crossiella sp. CA-258035 TaxID=2981138 RepID=UPI0024BBEF78|nr:lantibiotic dehydratase [Crossiella sp. CA-258035]WHT22380.1 lantibiotic dehydratase [Crossiella sp. CA-258035]